ncbi:Amino-acid permease BAT1 [Coccomyxa sp. Obi]|nr:Amino-acid permease BAT1 [Coccomyxa sp. Obi]
MSLENGKEIVDSGQARLAALGYKQELKRDFNLFTNSAISFSIISILTGITGSLGTAWNNGGPVAAVWGWVWVAVMTMTVGIAMAEIVSSLPSSGGPYFWSAHLATKRWSPLAAWMTGWFNLLGQAAVTAAIDYTVANHIAAMWLLANGHVFTQPQLLGAYAIILFLHAIINFLPTRILALMNGVSVVWHVVGTFVLIILLPAVAPTHQSAEFVFTTFYNDTSASGVPSPAYIFLLGILMSQFTLTGFDACGHMSEETKSADFSAPWGIIIAIATSAFVGWGYILALLFSIQDPDNLTTGNANGYISGQIFYDAFNGRYGTGSGGVVAMGIPLIAMFFCGASSVTSNSRMLWSFSRDGAVPGWQLWSAVNPLTKTPINAVIFMCTLAFILGLPMLNSVAAFFAVTSISVIGLYISYAIPIFIRLLNNKAFEPGPFNLGMAGIVISWIAVIWVCFITVVFVLPNLYPVTADNLNYAPVAVGIVLVGGLLFFYIPYFGAYRWYRGERHTVEDYTVHKKEADEAARAAGEPKMAT